MGLLSKGLFSLLGRVEKLNKATSLVGDRQFFDTQTFPWAAEVAAGTPEIQAELSSVLAHGSRLPNVQDISPDQSSITTDSGWKTFFFYIAGVRVDKNCARCPATDRALQKIPGMVSAFYSILAPGKSLPPHRGPYNGVLRFHLGLKIPAHDQTCAIRVGTETRSWAEGGALIFDDTYEHQAWNLTPEWRAVLFVDFKRPLPWGAAVLNAAMLWMITKTPLVAVALKNVANWEHGFYE
jgi:ornithine lipid ester-linked acyl 2-hydroxylase